MTTYPNLFIGNWDDPNANWDSGLQWDVNTGAAPGDVAPYLDLITSEHRDKIKFMTTLANVLQPVADNIFVLRGMYAKFDLDLAAGAQLDDVGLWVGVSRTLQVPLVGVYFSFDTAGVGFDEGTWRGPFDPATQFFTLSDAQYRLLLRARVLNNSWDGTVDQAYAIWDALFTGTDFGLLIQDYGNMHMLFAMTGSAPDAVTLALFTGGYLNNRPSGVQIDGYMIPSVSDTPYFGFDVQNASIAGFDTGAWGTLTPPA